MAGQGLHVKGYRELMRATALADKQSKRTIREEFRQVGERVRQEAAVSFASVSPRTAAGYRTRVRQRGIAVEQSLRKTTGTRPDFGRLQMRRALLPALYGNADNLERDLERALDRVCDRFDAGAA